jgi:hypothetical protein
VSVLHILFFKQLITDFVLLMDSLRYIIFAFFSVRLLGVQVLEPKKAADKKVGPEYRIIVSKEFFLLVE